MTTSMDIRRWSWTNWRRYGPDFFAADYGPVAGHIQAAYNRERRLELAQELLDTPGYYLLGLNFEYSQLVREMAKLYVKEHS